MQVVVTMPKCRQLFEGLFSKDWSSQPLPVNGGGQAQVQVSSVTLAAPKVHLENSTLSHSLQGMSYSDIKVNSANTQSKTHKEQHHYENSYVVLFFMAQGRPELRMYQDFSGIKMDMK